MALKDLSSREAVLNALREFDQLGRAAFLAKYGFAEAREYFVEHDGKRYDSKAIAGVAHGYQFPGQGPLASRDFSGGARQYWAFGANPRRYRIMEAVQHREVDTWTVGRRRPEAGDRAIIWKFKGDDARRGIVAFAEILSDPLPRTDAENPYWRDAADGATIEDRVDLRYVLAPGLPLWLDAYPELLGQLAVARATGGTMFRVTPEQWDAVVQLAGGWPRDAPEVAEAEKAVVEMAGRRRGRGQGFQPSAENRQAVERYAMDWVEEHYRSQGWDVEDVGDRESYDLCCRQAGRPDLHVEVKGTTGDGAAVLLTPNEVEHAREQYPHVALAIVAGIRLSERTHAGFRVFQPWQIDERSLEPVGFRYRVPALSSREP